MDRVQHLSGKDRPPLQTAPIPKSASGMQQSDVALAPTSKAMEPTATSSRVTDSGRPRRTAGRPQIEFSLSVVRGLVGLVLRTPVVFERIYEAVALCGEGKASREAIRKAIAGGLGLDAKTGLHIGKVGLADANDRAELEREQMEAYEERRRIEEQGSGAGNSNSNSDGKRASGTVPDAQAQTQAEAGAEQQHQRDPRKKPKLRLTAFLENLTKIDPEGKTLRDFVARGCAMTKDAVLTSASKISSLVGSVADSEYSFWHVDDDGFAKDGETPSDAAVEHTERDPLLHIPTGSSGTTARDITKEQIEGFGKGTANLVTLIWQLRRRRFSDQQVTAEIEHFLSTIDGVLESKLKDVINGTSHDGVTALHLATAYGYVLVCGCLLNRGADHCRRTQCGLTVYQFSKLAQRRARCKEPPLWGLIERCRLYVKLGKAPPVVSRKNSGCAGTKRTATDAGPCKRSKPTRPGAPTQHAPSPMHPALQGANKPRHANTAPSPTEGQRQNTDPFESFMADPRANASPAQWIEEERRLSESPAPQNYVSNPSAYSFGPGQHPLPIPQPPELELPGLSGDIPSFRWPNPSATSEQVTSVPGSQSGQAPWSRCGDYFGSSPSSSFPNSQRDCRYPTALAPVPYDDSEFGVSTLSGGPSPATPRSFMHQPQALPGGAIDASLAYSPTAVYPEMTSSSESILTGIPRTPFSFQNSPDSPHPLMQPSPISPLEGRMIRRIAAPDWRPKMMADSISGGPAKDGIQDYYGALQRDNAPYKDLSPLCYGASMQDQVFQSDIRVATVQHVQHQFSEAPIQRSPSPPELHMSADGPCSNPNCSGRARGKWAISVVTQEVRCNECLQAVPLKALVVRDHEGKRVCEQ